MRLQQLLLQTNAAARIGSWELNVETGELFWSEITKDIHEVGVDFIPTVDNALNFYPEGKCREQIETAVKACLETGAPYELETQIKTAKGNILWIKTLGIAERSNGKTIRIFGSLQDISEQKALQTELEQKSQEYRSLFDQNPNGVFTLDKNGYFTDINEEAVKLAGVPKDQIIGLHYSVFLPFERKEEVGDIFRQVLAGEKKQYELILNAVRENPIDAEITNMPVMVNEEVVGVYGVIRNITEKKVIERQLQESEERLRLALKGARDGLWDWDIKNNIRYKSERMAEMLGFTIEQIHDEAFYWSRFHPDDIERRERLLQDHLNKKTPFYNIELRIKTGNDEYRWFLSRGIATWDEKGVPVRITGSLTDIHEEKMLRHELEVSYSQLLKREIELKQTLDLQTALVNGLPDKILKIDEAGVVQYLHIPQNTVLFAEKLPEPGANIQETLGSTGKILLQKIRESIEKQELVVTDFTKQTGDATAYFEARIVPVENKMALVIIRNITEKQQALQESARKEIKYTRLIENMKLGILEVDNDEVVTRVHQSFCEMTGYREEELVGQKASDLLMPASEGNKMEEVVGRRKKGLSDYYEIRMQKKSGDIMDVLVSGTPLYDNEGKVIGSAGIHYDITQQKRTASLLEESNKIGKVGTYELDLVQQQANWNEIMWDIYETEPGYTPRIEEIMAFFPEGECRDKATEVFNRLLTREADRCDEVFDIRTAKGNRKWIRTVAEVEFYQNIPRRIVGIALDITQAMRDEQQLKEYAALSETIVTSITDGFYVVDNKYRMLFANDSACKYVEKSREELIGNDIWKMFPHAKELFFDVFEDVRKNKEPKTISQRYDDGNTNLWLDITVYPTREGGVSVLYRDITPEKQAEESIRNLNAKYRAITKATNQIIYEWDLNSQQIEFNDVYFNVTGYENKPEVKNGSFNLSMVHPEDLERVQQSINQCITSHQPFWDSTYRFKVADGSYRHMHSQGILHYDGQGRPLSLLGTIEDITERIRLNEKLIREKVIAQRRISEAVIDAQEKEREYIGHELHDNVNQILTTATLYMQLAESEAYQSTHTIEEVQKLIRKAIEEIRLLSRTLTPPSLKDIGLSVAIRDLTTLVAKASSIHFRVNMPEVLMHELNNEKSLVLYRICQELLNNVIKYSQATNCFVILERTAKNFIRLTVIDDGKGFTTSKVKKGVGLNSTVARVEVYGGKFKVQSEPGKGCTVTVEIPV
jgi:two-component system sensor histidine kinase UhpB